MGYPNSPLDGLEWKNPIQMDDLGIFRVPPCQEMYAEGTLELMAIYDHTLSNLSDIGSLLQRAWSKQHVKSGLSMPKPCFKTHQESWWFTDVYREIVWDYQIIILYSSLYAFNPVLFWGLECYGAAYGFQRNPKCGCSRLQRSLRSSCWSTTKKLWTK